MPPQSPRPPSPGRVAPVNKPAARGPRNHLTPRLVAYPAALMPPQSHRHPSPGRVDQVNNPAAFGLSNHTTLRAPHQTRNGFHSQGQLLVGAGGLNQASTVDT